MSNKILFNVDARHFSSHITENTQRLQLVKIDDPVHKQVKILFHTLASLFLFYLSDNYIQ